MHLDCTKALHVYGRPGCRNCRSRLFVALILLQILLLFSFKWQSAKQYSQSLQDIVRPAPCFIFSLPSVKTEQKFSHSMLNRMSKLVPLYENHQDCVVAEALRLSQLMQVCTMHAGTAGDLANRAIAKQLLAPPDWGRLAAPLIRVAHSIVETTFSVIKGAVHGFLHPCLASGMMHPYYLCFLPSETLGSF